MEPYQTLLVVTVVQAYLNFKIMMRLFEHGDALGDLQRQIDFVEAKFEQELIDVEDRVKR